MTAYHRVTRTDLPGLVVEALATIRLVRLIREDTITEGLRARFFKRFPTHLQQTPEIERPRGAGWQPLEAPGGEVLGWFRQPRIGPFVHDLLGCPYWCLSVWAGAGILVGRRCGPVGRFLVRTLVLSQITAVTYDVAVPLRALKERVEAPPKKQREDDVEWPT